MKHDKHHLAQLLLSSIVERVSFGIKITAFLTRVSVAMPASVTVYDTVRRN